MLHSVAQNRETVLDPLALSTRKIVDSRRPAPLPLRARNQPSQLARAVP